MRPLPGKQVQGWLRFYNDNQPGSHAVNVNSIQHDKQELPAFFGLLLQKDTGHNLDRYYCTLFIAVYTNLRKEVEYGKYKINLPWKGIRYHARKHRFHWSWHHGHAHGPELN